jgi:hypothetical protein
MYSNIRDKNSNSDVIHTSDTSYHTNANSKSRFSDSITYYSSNSRPMAKDVIVAIERPFTNELYVLHPFNVYTPRAYDLLLHDCSNRLRVQVSQIYSIRVRLTSGMYHTINSCESMSVLSDMSKLEVTCFGDNQIGKGFHRN